MVDVLVGQPNIAAPANTATGQHVRPFDGQRPGRRRKVRKGTRSCWECKRRKIRCIFASSDDVTCLSCQRRRAPCVSQDLPEDLSPARIGNRHLGVRIAKVEDFMKEILSHKDAEGLPHIQTQTQQGRCTRPESSALHSDFSGVPPIRARSTISTGLRKTISSSSIPTPDSQGVSSSADLDPALAQLLSAFPANDDAKLLAKESSRTVLYNEVLYTQPHSKLTYETFTTLCPQFKLPGRNAHPVIIARCMLIFAIALQSPARDKYLSLSEPQDVFMHNLVLAATTWLTTMEKTQGTVEGLICVILEGIFEINCGNLRKAWAVFRRAMTAAQLMGLHRSPKPILKYLDARTDADPEILWFRIVYVDRYLSLLLGLPQGTSEKNSTLLSAERNEPPLGRFERRLTVIASCILERNERVFDPNELTTTQSIDAELLNLSRSMPSSFWRPVNFHGFVLGEPDTYLETLRLGAQVYYYGLLIQLHLPYMVRVGTNNGHEYAKTACVNASREILSRFIAHRSFNPASSCSRPVDFFALLAAMTLVLAHLDSQSHRGITNFLAHQRSSDRAILDQVLETMNAISKSNDDNVTEKSALVVQRLLDIEADASEGGDYIARSVRGDDNSREGEKEDGGLRLNIPYLGTVKISRQGPISREQSRMTSHLAYNNGPSIQGDSSTTDERPICPLNVMISDSSISRIAMPSECPAVQLQTPGNEESMLEYSDPSQDTTLQPPDALVPIAIDADDWTFQGVDVAFFDSLMRGTSCIDADLEQQWLGNPSGTSDHE